MIVHRAADAEAEDANHGRSVDGFFSGRATLAALAEADAATVRMNRVSFEAGARTVWHSHDDGQLLIVVEGEGSVAARDRVEPVGVGDVVWTDAGEEHWHGAGENSGLVHVAVSLGTTQWQRP